MDLKCIEPEGNGGQLEEFWLCEYSCEMARTYQCAAGESGGDDGPHVEAREKRQIPADDEQCRDRHKFPAGLLGVQCGFETIFMSQLHEGAGVGCETPEVGGGE